MSASKYKAPKKAPLSGHSGIAKSLQQGPVQRIDAKQNMARFYVLAIEPTLFRNMSLVRNWGSIATRGQERLQLFENERPALTLFLEILREKRRKGYRPVSRGREFQI